MEAIVERVDLCSYAIIGYVLQMIVVGATKAFPRFARFMWWSAILTLLTVGGAGYATVLPTSFWYVVAIALVAWITASAVALASMVLIPPFMSLYDGWRENVKRQRRDAEIATEIERIAAQNRHEFEMAKTEADEKARLAQIDAEKAFFQQEARLVVLQAKAEEEKARLETERLALERAKREAFTKAAAQKEQMKQNEPSQEDTAQAARADFDRRVEIIRGMDGLEPEDIEAQINSEKDKLAQKLREILR